jgi:hypothetical protein
LATINLLLTGEVGCVWSGEVVGNTEKLEIFTINAYFYFDYSPNCLFNFTPSPNAFNFKLSLLIQRLNFIARRLIMSLKVVGNEKVGGSRRWHMIDIGLGPW